MIKYMRLHASMYACVCVCMRVHACVRVCACACAYIYANTYTFECMRMYNKIYTEHSAYTYVYEFDFNIFS